MSQLLVQRVHQLNEKLLGLQEHLASCDHQTFNRKPGPNKWSAAQTMHHVMLSEKLSLQYCEKKLSFDPKLHRSGALASVREAAVRYYLQSPLKFKAPKGLGTAFLPAEDSLDHTLDQWWSQRQRLEQFFEDLPLAYWDKQVYKHPLVGRLSFEGMLSFFQAHFLHHRKQILKAITS